MLWLRSRKVYVVRAARRAPSTAGRSPSLPEGGRDENLSSLVPIVNEVVRCTMKSSHCSDEVVSR